MPTRHVHIGWREVDESVRSLSKARADDGDGDHPYLYKRRYLLDLGQLLDAPRG